MQTSLRGIANKARADRHHRFGNLFGLLNEEGLRSCWRLLNTRAASGVDRVTAREYAKDLVANVGRLVERLKRGSYRAKLVRRRHIPKEGGRTRPLGIPAVEDKLLQTAAARILGAIYEQDFLPCSWAYRQGRGAREAVRTLTQELQFGCYGYVVEIDIRGFFDHIDHDWMLKMLAVRVADSAVSAADPEMAEGRGVGGGRTGTAPGGRQSSGRQHLSDPGQHLPSLRARSLVCAQGEAPEQGPSLHVPVRRRCGVCVPARG